MAELELIQVTVGARLTGCQLPHVGNCTDQAGATYMLRLPGRDVFRQAQAAQAGEASCLSSYPRGRPQRAPRMLKNASSESSDGCGGLRQSCPRKSRACRSASRSIWVVLDKACTHSTGSNSSSNLSACVGWPKKHVFFWSQSIRHPAGNRECLIGKPVWISKLRSIKTSKLCTERH